MISRDVLRGLGFYLVTGKSFDEWCGWELQAEAWKHDANYWVTFGGISDMELTLIHDGYGKHVFGDEATDITFLREFMTHYTATVIETLQFSSPFLP